MNYEMITLRLLHIVFGVFWAGSAIFIAFILQPRLRTLGPEIQAKVMGSLITIMAPALITSAVITILAGMALSIRLRWGQFDAFVNTGWGWAILLGFLVSIGALFSGIRTMILIKRLTNLSSEIGDRSPTAKESEMLNRLRIRLPKLARSTATMVLIALVTMACARFV